MFCQLFLHCFTSPRFIEEVFIFNQIRDKCKIIAHLFWAALDNYCRRQGGDIEDDNLVANILHCLKSIFVVYGVVGELLISLRKFLEYLNGENKESFIFKIIINYTFEEAIFSSMFGVSYDKKTKLEHE